LVRVGARSNGEVNSPLQMLDGRGEAYVLGAEAYAY